jgi:hypothetical protein
MDDDTTRHEAKERAARQAYSDSLAAQAWQRFRLDQQAAHPQPMAAHIRPVSSMSAGLAAKQASDYAAGRHGTIRSASQVKRKMGKGKKVVLVIVGVFVALAVLGALVGSPKQAPAAPALTTHQAEVAACKTYQASPGLDGVSAALQQVPVGTALYHALWHAEVSSGAVLALEAPINAACAAVAAG